MMNIVLCIHVLLLFICTQVAVKNSIDVFYFSVLIPLNIFFVEDGKMGMIVTHYFLKRHYACHHTMTSVDNKIYGSH